MESPSSMSILVLRVLYDSTINALRPFKINCAVWVRIFGKRYEGGSWKETHRALFICVCFLTRDRKRYAGGDSNHTIYFERPKEKSRYPQYPNSSELLLLYYWCHNHMHWKQFRIYMYTVVKKWMHLELSCPNTHNFDQEILV